MLARLSLFPVWKIYASLRWSVIVFVCHKLIKLFDSLMIWRWRTCQIKNDSFRTYLTALRVLPKNLIRYPANVKWPGSAGKCIRPQNVTWLTIKVYWLDWHERYYDLHAHWSYSQIIQQAVPLIPVMFLFREPVVYHAYLPIGRIICRLNSPISESPQRTKWSFPYYLFIRRHHARPTSLPHMWTYSYYR